MLVNIVSRGEYMSLTFTLDDDQQAIRESAHEFARDVIRPAAPHHDSTGTFPWEVLTQAFDAGLMNLHGFIKG